MACYSFGGRSEANLEMLALFLSSQVCSGEAFDVCSQRERTVPLGFEFLVHTAFRRLRVYLTGIQRILS
eukprot:1189509-Prorocentrum_minimum.AAC.2